MKLLKNIERKPSISRGRKEIYVTGVILAFLFTTDVRVLIVHLNESVPNSFQTLGIDKLLKFVLPLHGAH